MEKLKDFGRKLMYGRNDYSPKVKKILKEFGNEPITNMYILRTPISKVLRFIMNITSLGQFEKKLKEKDFDDLFHLALHIETSKGRVSLEKNEVISMTKKPKRADNSQMMNVSVPQGVTINQLLDKTKEKMGDKYYGYQAKSNNCQFYILSILQANGLANKENTEFIKQDTNSLFSTHLRKASNTVTDFAGKLDVLLQGGAIKKSNNIEMDKKTKDKKAKELADLIIGSGFFDDIGNWAKRATSDVSNWGKQAGKDIKKTFTSKKAKKITKSALPVATAGVLGAVGGIPGAVIGHVAGEQLADNVIGKGVRKGRMEKGSPQAIAWGQKMRDARNKH